MELKEPILFWYPVVYPDEDYPEETVVEQECGRIIPYHLTEEPAEVDVEARGCSFHLIFGRKTNGMFLCIPNRSIGIELSSLSDRGLIMDSLISTDRIDYEESTAIVWALSGIADLFRLLHRMPGPNNPSEKINHAGGLNDR